MLPKAGRGGGYLILIINNIAVFCCRHATATTSPVSQDSLFLVLEGDIAIAILRGVQDICTYYRICLQ